MNNVKKSTMEKFEKSLTKEELELDSYLDWSNETLGRCVKAMAKHLYEKDVKGFESVKTMSAVYLLIHSAMEFNAGDIRQTVGGFTNKRYPDAPQNWEIIVREIKPSKGQKDKRSVASKADSSTDDQNQNL